MKSKKALSVLISVALLATALSACARVKDYEFSSALGEGDLSVVSYNTAAPWGNALKGTGSGVRVGRFAKYMNSVKPDIIGTQEMNSDWIGKLETLMPDYDSYGVKRGGDDNEKRSEMNTIYWLRDRFECVEKSTFWLSETPNEESRFDGAGCHRVCSYVMLRDKQSGNYILALNTHLDNSSEQARTFGAQVIMDKLDEIRAINEIGEYTIVLTGDFNGELESEACQTINALLGTVKVDGCTYQDWGEITEDEPIDFIFTSGTSRGTIRLDDMTNGFVSDHYGIYSVIDF